MEGHNIITTCEATGIPLPTIVWTFSSSVLMSDSVSIFTIPITGNGGIPGVFERLTIMNVSRALTGRHRCSANNIVGSDTSSGIDITIQCKLVMMLLIKVLCSTLKYLYLDPPEITSNVADVTEYETTSVTFSCDIIGEPIPAISWYFNDVMIIASDKYVLLGGAVRGSAQSLLIINNATSSDSGTYTCRAETFVGSDSSSLILMLNGNYVKVYIHSCIKMLYEI